MSDDQDKDNAAKLIIGVMTAIILLGGALAVVVGMLLAVLRFYGLL